MKWSGARPKLGRVCSLGLCNLLTALALKAHDGVGRVLYQIRSASRWPRVRFISQAGSGLCGE